MRNSGLHLWSMTDRQGGLCHLPRAWQGSVCWTPDRAWLLFSSILCGSDAEFPTTGGAADTSRRGFSEEDLPVCRVALRGSQDNLSSAWQEIWVRRNRNVSTVSTWHSKPSNWQARKGTRNGDITGARLNIYEPRLYG